MRTHVEFRTSRFPPYAEEEAQVNPGRYGKRLAEFLRKGLAAHGMDAGEIYAEDWGWAVPIKNEAFDLWIGCGNYDEYEDGFLCFIEPSTPTVRRGLFKKVDTTVDVERVAAAMEAILLANADIRGVRWWSEDEAKRGGA
jgi:hypothetical protein